MQQMLNCWLAYVVSLPIELDLHALLYLLKDYLGVFTVLTFFNRNSYYLTVPVSEEKKEKSFEDVII